MSIGEPCLDVDGVGISGGLEDSSTTVLELESMIIRESCPVGGSRCLGFDVDGVGWISGGLEDSSMTGIVRLRFPVTVDGADMTFFSKVAFT